MPGGRRLGGVHALGGLADDAPTGLLRQTCIDVLCAYLRLPYTAEARPAARRRCRPTRLPGAARGAAHHHPPHPRPHAVGPEETSVSWQGYDLDFPGVVFDGGDFTGAVFAPGATVSFRDARFSDGTCSFVDACFSGGTVSFGGATFSGGTVFFSQAVFCGGRVDFGATFSGGARSAFAAHSSPAPLSTSPRRPAPRRSTWCRGANRSRPA